MTAHPQNDFEALAAGAAYCARYGGSFVLFLNGEVDDSFDTLDQAADAYIQFWSDDETRQILEFAPSGASTDVTQEARERVEQRCEARDLPTPWEEAV